MSQKIEDYKDYCVTLSKDAICDILPHRHRSLLLDDFFGKKDDYISGSFLVTFEICEGHDVFNGNKVMRGVDLLEMSAQLLGLGAWFLLREKGFCPRKTLLRKFGESKFLSPVFPGQRVVSILKLNDLEVRNIRDLGTKVVGRDFNICEGSSGKLVAHISFIELFVTS